MTASLARLPLLLILVLPMPACAASGGSVATGPGLTENRWRPIQIDGHTVTVPEQQHEPWIHLDSKSKRVTGSGGCNRFNGSFQAGDAPTSKSAAERRGSRLQSMGVPREHGPAPGADTASGSTNVTHE